MKEAVEELGLKGAEVTISIPEGERVGKETLNSRIGVEGGISILGSTGFVEPWNDHLGEMRGDLIRCTDKVVLTTGRIGMTLLSYALSQLYRCDGRKQDLGRA